MTTEALERLIGGYLAAWNESDGAARENLLDQVWAESGHYTDPQSDSENRSTLSQLISRLHAKVPGARFTLDGPIDHHHQFVRFAWTMTLPNGSTLKGMDFGEVTDDNRLCRIVGFF